LGNILHQDFYRESNNYEFNSCQRDVIITSGSWATLLLSRDLEVKVLLLEGLSVLHDSGEQDGLQDKELILHHRSHSKVVRKEVLLNEDDNPHEVHEREEIFLLEIGRSVFELPSNSVASSSSPSIFDSETRPVFMIQTMKSRENNE
jgi:hypothetical protein